VSTGHFRTSPIKAITHKVIAFFGPTARVRFARVRALLWAILGAVSVPLGWANSVFLVWMASVYANVESGIAAGEAADDTDVTGRLDRIEANQRRMEASQQRILDLLERGQPS